MQAECLYITKEQFRLKQNKDRYPVLEKANKLLTKTYDRLTADIENVKAAIAWYDENEGK